MTTGHWPTWYQKTQRVRRVKELATCCSCGEEYRPLASEALDADGECYCDDCDATDAAMAYVEDAGQYGDYGDYR